MQRPLSVVVFLVVVFTLFGVVSLLSLCSLHVLVPSLTGAWRTAVPRAKKRLQFSSLVGASVRWELETCHAASYTTFALLGAFSRWGLGRVSSVPWMAGRAYNGLGTGWGNLTLGRLCAKLSRWNLVLVMMISQGWNLVSQQESMGYVEKEAYAPFRGCPRHGDGSFFARRLESLEGLAASSRSCWWLLGDWWPECGGSQRPGQETDPAAFWESFEGGP